MLGPLLPQHEKLCCNGCAGIATSANAAVVQSPKAQLDLYEAKDGSVYVKGLNTFVVKSVEEIASVLEVGGGGSCRLSVVPLASGRALPAAGALQCACRGLPHQGAVHATPRGLLATAVRRWASATALWGPR